MDDWFVKRRAELEAAAPKKNPRKAVAFAKLELDAAIIAFTAMNCKKAIVWAWLIHKTWYTKNPTVKVTNVAMAKLGVPREAKRQALLQLEKAGLILIEHREGKAPIVTIL
jgi:hypothetical protein